MPTLQAISAAGQSRLMETYNRSLDRHRLVAAQVLLVPHDFVDRRQYLHARQTLVRLLELGCVPIVNENDAIASDEIRYGDNDRIAALVAHNVNADLLVLLTDTPGLYTADPRTDPTAELIDVVAADDPLLSVAAARPGSNRGSGGMASKLSAARMASWSGVRAVIATADQRQRADRRGARRATVGTTFLPSSRSLAGAQAVDRFRHQRRGCGRRRRRRPAGAGRARHVAAARRRRRGGRRRSARATWSRFAISGGVVVAAGMALERRATSCAASSASAPTDLPAHVAHEVDPPRRPGC